MSDGYSPTARTAVGRLPKRAAYDRTVIHAILDEGFLCHVGFVVDGQPYVIPTSYARVGEQLYLHGSAASRMLRSLAAGIDVCVTVTLLDGLVLARSVFHHSMNYRSVVVLGPRAGGERTGGEDGGAARLYQPHHRRSLGRGAAAHGAGTESDERPRVGAEGSFREGAERAPAR